MIVWSKTEYGYIFWGYKTNDGVRIQKIIKSLFFFGLLCNFTEKVGNSLARFFHETADYTFVNWYWDADTLLSIEDNSKCSWFRETLRKLDIFKRFFQNKKY